MAIKKFRKYEIIYLVQPEATEEERQKVHDRVNGVIEEGEAWLLEREDWGKRKLAYEIRKHNKAYYYYMTLIASPGVTTEIERILRMLDPCIRFMTIKLEDEITEDRVQALVETAAEAAAEASSSEEASNG